MADRSIVVRLKAQVGDFTAGMRDAAKSTDDVALKAETAAGRIGESMTRHRDSWDRAGTSLLAFGAATTAAVAGTVKAAMDWESAWTGVTKTVDATATTSLPQLEEGLRGLATTLPASHEQIAAVAEAAGQLGVSADDVVGFTETMINLGETTNLTAEEAATGLARFANVTGTAMSDVDRLGSVLVDLGNNFATTESEVLAMGQRLAAAGTQAGMSEGDILGLSAALSSVGVEAEAGGTAMSTTMKRIGEAVRGGGDELEKFAELAGMSSEQFRTAWEQDSAGALASVVQGLGDMQAAGGDANGALTELGITGIRESDAMLRLASAGDLVTNALNTGNVAFAANSALQAEAQKRYDTTAAKLAIAKNTIVDAAISIGQAFLPAVAGVAEGIAGIVSWFEKLPGPVKTAIGAIGGIAGGVSLLAGGLLLVVPRIVETVKAFKTLKTVASGLKIGGILSGISLGPIGLAVGAIAALTAGIIAFKQHADEVKQAAIDKSIQRIVDAGNSMDFTAGRHSVEDFFGSMTEPAEVAESLMISTFNAIKESGGEMAGEYSEYLHEIDAAMAELVGNGQGAEAAALFEDLASKAAEQGVSMDDLAKRLPEYGDALREAGQENGKTADEVDEATTATLAYEDALRGVIDAQQEAAGIVLSQREAVRQLEESYDSAAEAIAKNGANLDASTAAGRANQEALDDIADSALDLASSMADAGSSTDEIQASMTTARGNFISTAEAMGMSESEAEALANSLGLIPGDYTADVNADSAGAEADTKRTQALLDAIPGVYQADLDAATSAANGKIKTTQDKANAFDRFLGTAKLDANTRQALSAIQGADAKADAWDRMTATADVRAADRTAGGVGSAKRALASVHDKTVTITTRYNAIHTSVGPSTLASSPFARRASGGAIQGAGTSTSDSILVRASNGEHVWTAAEVQAVGGQGAMYALRSMAMSGQLRFASGGAVGGVPAYASGGPVARTTATAPPPVYVQNPFTGDYLLARMDQRAGLVASGRTTPLTHGRAAW